jgi:adenylate cyclase
LLHCDRQKKSSWVRYHFEGYVLDTDRRELRLRADLVSLEPQVFDLLAYLIQNRARVLTKEDLLAAIWEGRVISESTLTSRINAARRSIGDSGNQQRRIKTFPRKGIRFVAPVKEEHQNATAGANEPTSQPGIPDRPSIAVLPFTNLSGLFEQEHVADGIIEDITTELSRFRELFVIARNSSFHYKGRSVDVRQIGRELGVRYVLEGSIQRDCNRFRISAQLIDTTTGAHRWAERYDREMKDVFAVHDEIALDVAGTLAAHVSKAEAERILLKPATSWQSYDFYMRAADAYATFHRRMEISTIYETRRLLDQCLAMEWGFVRAHVLYSSTLVSTWGLALDNDHLKPATLERAHKGAESAIQLDPNLPQARAQIAYVLCFQGSRAAAVAEFERAIVLNPNFTDWRFAPVLIFAGQAERALEVAKAHLRVDPFALPIARGFLGLAYLMLRRYSEAVGPLREFVSEAPNHRPGRVWVTAAYAHLGELEEARRHGAQLLRMDPDLVATKKARKTDDFWLPDDLEHLFDGLRKAGLPVA